MVYTSIENYHLILGSKSPRRKKLLANLGVPFEVVVKEVNEDIQDGKDGIETAINLARLKAEAFAGELADPKVIVLTADTVVWLDDEHLAKPGDEEEAARMLRKLSNRQHEVITGVCLSNLEKRKVFHSTTRVWFKELTEQEIEYYITHYRPFDKAGAYGVQEWIGHIGITRIEGSYFNVVGLPVQMVYEKLLNFIQ
jgi:septum formation protein